MRTIIAALMAAAGFISCANAQTSCDKPRNDFDGIYCLGKVYQQADQDLNASYPKLQTQLDAPGVEILRRGQIAWIRSRDASCSEHKGDRFLVDLNCATKMTIARNQFLEDRLRECLSSGCRNSRLSAGE